MVERTDGHGRTMGVKGEEVGGKGPSIAESALTIIIATPNAPTLF